MKWKFYTLFCVIIVFKSVVSQTLVINEVSQGASGTREYVELLVTGSPTCNAIPCMDLRGFIIDDNNGNHATGTGVGIASGCIRFRNISFWECIPYGTIIVVYNDADPNPNVPAPDLSMSDNNCRLIIPISDCTLLERHTTIPNTTNPNYPLTGYTTCGAWGPLGMANGDDSFQTITPGGVLIHSVSWGNNNLAPIIYFAGSAAGSVARMTNAIDNNPFNQANWVMSAVLGNETPGLPNNAANQSWINSMNNGCNILLPLAASVNSVNPGCICNGSATVSASGAIGPYTYTWLPAGGNASVATGLCSGIYTVNITSSNGCILTQTINLTSISGMTATSSFTNVSCNGGTNGSAAVNVSGGTPGYTYNWLPSGGTASVATGLSAGTYSVLVTDNNSCTTTAVANITQPTSLSPLISFTNVSCNGGTNGSAAVNVSGGTPGYTYNWLPSGGTASVATGLSAGTFSVLVTDNNSCTTTAIANITQPSTLTPLISLTNVSCNAGANGSAAVNVSGGTPGYTYNWLPSGGTASLATGLSAGNYSVLVTDNNSCTTTAIANITQPASLTPLISFTNVSCNGGSNGSAAVNVSGGTPGYTYNWLASGGTASLATGLLAGTYTVLVTDNNSCTTTAITTITQPTSLTTLSSFTNVTCNGGTNGSAAVNVSGGTPGYTYNWLPSGGTASLATGLSAGTYTVLVTDNNNCTITAVATIAQPTSLSSAITTMSTGCGVPSGSATVTISGGTPGYTYNWLPSGGTASVATGLSAGTYTVLVTDNNSCTITAFATIIQPTSLSALSSFTNLSCNGGSNGSAAVNVSGGTPGYTYNWLPSGGTASIATGLSAGTYTVLVTDNNSCTTTAVANITQPASITTSSSFTNVTCNGGTNGSAAVNVSGGTPGYTYNWLPSGGTASLATGLSAGTYTILVTDNISCTATAIANIIQPASITALSSFTNVSCNGGTNGSAAVNVSGGTPGYTYNWLPSGGTASLAIGLSAGTYSVLVTDNNNCTTTAVATITQPTSLTTLSSFTNVSCNLGTNGSAAVNVSGGTPGYTYNWLPSGGTASLATVLSAGTYSVFVTDNNSCTTTAVANITQPASITTLSSYTNVICNGGANGSAAVNVSGGTPGYTYNWLPSGGTASVATGLLAGTYSLIVTDNNSCTTQISYSISEPLPILLSVNSLTLCNGSNGMLSVNVTGGSGPLTYSWNGVTGSSSMNVQPSVTTNYTIQVTDIQGCVSSPVISTVEVLQPLSLQVSPAVTVCPNTNISTIFTVSPTGGTGQYTVNWQPMNVNSLSIAVNPEITQNYSVTVTDGCTSPSVQAITGISYYSISESQINLEKLKGCAPLCLTFSNTAISNTSSNVLNWLWYIENKTDTSASPYYCFSNPGIYRIGLSYTTKEGCKINLKSKDSVVVYEKPQASFYVSNSEVDVYNSEVKVFNTSKGAQNYAWYSQQLGLFSNEINPVMNFDKEGNYAVFLVATNQYGCSDTASRIIKVDHGFTFYAPNSFSPNGDGINDVFLPLGTYWDLNSYKLELFNRWGEEIFSTGDWKEGWDGRKNRQGEIVKDDVYVWKAVVQDLKGEQHQFTGHVTLLK